MGQEGMSLGAEMNAERDVSVLLKCRVTPRCQMENAPPKVKPQSGPWNQVVHAAGFAIEKRPCTLVSL